MARKTKALKKDDTPQIQRPVRFSDVLEEIPRDVAEAALRQSGDPHATRFLQLWRDPKLVRKQPGEIAEMAGLTLAAFQRLWSDHNLQKGLIRLSSHTPQVLEDVAIDAKSKWDVCPKCDGAGELTEQKIEQDENGEVKVALTRVCPKCEGQKKVRVAGDKDARNLVFETLKLTGQRGPLVALQQNFGAPETISERVAAVEKLTGWGS